MIVLLFGVLLQAESKEAVLDRLEGKARTVDRVHAEYDLKGLPQAKGLTLDFEAGKWLHFTLEPKAGPTPHYLLESWKRYSWREGETGVWSDFQPFFAGVDKGLNEVLRLLGREAAESPASAFRISLGLNLEGKPARDERGSFRFYTGFTASTFAWLGDLRKETEIEMGGEGSVITFRIPSRRKAVTVDRASGFLKSIEVQDFDGTPRALVSRSVELNGKPAERPKAPACRRAPISREELDDCLMSRRVVFQDLLFQLIPRWDQVVAKGLTKAVAEAYGREISDQTSVWREIRLHQLAAWAVHRQMDQGSPWRSLKESEAADAASFSEFVGKQDKDDVDTLKKGLQDFEGALEGTFRDAAPKGSDPAKFRALLRSSLDFDALWKKLGESTPGRAAEVYREELDNARTL